MRLAAHIQAIQPPPITEVKSWIADRAFPVEKPLIDLCQAIPSYPPPAELIAHLKAALNEQQTFKYSSDEGLPEARQEVCRWYQRRYKSAPDSDQVCLTIGASQAFWLAISALCEPGDEVIVQLPAYFDHPMGLKALSINPVYAPFNPETAGMPDIETIAALIGPRTRAILLVTPSNPTGTVIPSQLIEELFLLAKKRNIALILDETYNAFLDNAPHRLFQRKDWPETFIQIASFGKTFALTGLRCGALIGSCDLIHQALKVQDSMAVCQPRPAQIALTYGCRYLDNWVTENACKMRLRHDRFREEFLAADTPFRMIASGSFFAWIAHPWPELTGREATRRLLDDASLICLPGESFGPQMGQYLRLAFGNLEEQQISAAVKRLS